jgi:hypothetical protein
VLSDCSSNLALRTCAKHGCFNTAKRTSAHQCSVIAPAILHTHLCSAWLFQHSQTHKGRCSAWLLLHSQTHLLSSLSILHHTPKFSMGVQNFEGNDFHFGLITPSDPHLPHFFTCRGGGTNKLRTSLALLFSSYTVKTFGCFCSASNCSNGSKSNLLAQSAILACVGNLANQSKGEIVVSSSFMWNTSSLAAQLVDVEPIKDSLAPSLSIQSNLSGRNQTRTLR